MLAFTSCSELSKENSNPNKFEFYQNDIKIAFSSLENIKTFINSHDTAEIFLIQENYCEKCQKSTITSLEAQLETKDNYLMVIVKDSFDFHDSAKFNSFNFYSINSSKAQKLNIDYVEDISFNFIKGKLTRITNSSEW